MSLMVWNKGFSFSSSEGAPSVKNKITRFFCLPASSVMDDFRRLNAFWKAGRYCVVPKETRTQRDVYLIIIVADL